VTYPAARALALFLLLSPPLAAAPVLASAAGGTCAAAQYREFDFWLGDWDVFDVGAPATPVARAHITRILDGCVVHELYEAASGGLHGESYSIYDRTRSLWHQTWVTNRGRLLQIEGGQREERMMFNGSYLADDGKNTLIRALWWAVRDGVRERAEVSADDGHTWQPSFDLVFHAHHGP
jgi:hypothetical protein